MDDAGLLQLWVWLMVEASWKPRKLPSGEEIPLGSVTASVRDMADRFHCGKSTIARRLEKLESLGMVKLSAGHRFSVISLSNWTLYQSTYQDTRDAGGTLAGHTRDAGGTLAGHPKEGKKERKQEGKNKTGRASNENPADSPAADPASPPLSPPAPTAPLGDPRAKPLSLPLELDQPAFQAAWSEWLAYRVERRLTCRERTMRAQLAALAPLGPVSAAECVRTSIRNGWQGIFPEKVSTNGRPPATARVGPGQRFRSETADV